MMNLISLVIIIPLFLKDQVNGSENSTWTLIKGTHDDRFQLLTFNDSISFNKGLIKLKILSFKSLENSKFIKILSENSDIHVYENGEVINDNIISVINTINGTNTIDSINENQNKMETSTNNDSDLFTNITNFQGKFYLLIIKELRERVFFNHEISDNIIHISIQNESLNQFSINWVIRKEFRFKFEAFIHDLATRNSLIINSHLHRIHLNQMILKKLFSIRNANTRSVNSLFEAGEGGNQIQIAIKSSIYNKNKKNRNKNEKNENNNENNENENENNNENIKDIENENEIFKSSYFVICCIDSSILLKIHINNMKSNSFVSNLNAFGMWKNIPENAPFLFYQLKSKLYSNGIQKAGNKLLLMTLGPSDKIKSIENLLEYLIGVVAKNCRF